jgi:hypothetical protein
MNIDSKVVWLALEALESFKEISDFTPAIAVHAITALREALEQPAHEPAGKGKELSEQLKPN